MSVLDRLTCPECGKVIRPARPVTVGKKVRCPKCEAVFVARSDEEDEEDRPRPKKKKDAPAKKAKSAPAPKPKEPAKKKTEDDEDGGTYGYIKDESEEEEDDRPKVDYAPEVKVKDLRGPATQKIMRPSNYLLLAGVIGAASWIILALLIIMPAVFPLPENTTEPRKAPGIGRGLAAMVPQGAQPPAPPKPVQKGKDEDPGFFVVQGHDLGMAFASDPATAILAMFGLIIGSVYACCTTYGAVQMQHLESRGWGIAGSILAMLPLNSGGAQTIVYLVLQFIVIQFEWNDEYGKFLVIFIPTLVWLMSVAAGVYALIALNDEDVIAGFEYVPD
jgi:hypothetical protein